MNRRVLAGVGAIALVVVASVAGGVYLALGEPCFDPEPSDLSLSAMADVKRSVDAHTREPDQELVLDGDAASFLLADFLRYPVRLDFEGGVVSARLGVPVGGQCVNVQFEGRVTVDDAVATVDPDAVRIGRLDVSPIARARTWTVTSADLWRPHAQALLDAVRFMEVRGDVAAVRIDDPWGLR